MITPREHYSNTCDELVKRIVALGPCILELKSTWDLFAMGLDVKDLEASFAQASAALAEAKRQLRGKTP